jgi:hypothetical protein
MRTKEIVFDRQPLYEEVWATPLTELGKKYGLSDNGIRKVCKAMNIPLPEQGHWAKVAAGHVVTRKALPQDAERTRFVSRIQIESTLYKSPADDEFLAQQLAFEEKPENRIECETQPRRWHKVIIPSRDALRAAVAAIPQMRRDVERAAKNPRVRTEPNFTGWRWDQFNDDGQLLASGGMLRVTPKTYERALAILNALCFSAETRGYVPSYDEKAARLVLSGHGGRVEVRTSERLEEKWEKRPGWNGKIENKKTLAPTGELRLFVGESYRERQLLDGDSTLENQLNDIFVKVARHVVHQREATREREEWRRTYEVQRKQQEEAAARQRRIEELKKQLHADVKFWHEATLIRQYLDALERSGRAGESPEWFAWAREYADELDPLTRERKRGLVDGDSVNGGLVN